MDDEYFICEEGSRVSVMVNGKSKNMRVPFEDMKQDLENKSTLFNPLVEPLGHTAERKWFFSSRTKMVGDIVHDTMRRLLELCLAEEEKEANYDQISLAQGYHDRVDSKMLKELERIAQMKLMRIMYNRRKRVIQLHTDIYNDEYLRTKLKLRKKTIEVFRDMFGDIMSSTDIHEDYTYVSVEMGMPEIECFINILHMFSRSVDPYTSTLFDVDLYPAELEANLEHLSAFRKKCSYLVSATIQEDKTVKEDAKKPVSTTTMSVIPGNGTGVHVGGGLPSPHIIPGTFGSTIPMNTLAYGAIANRAAVDELENIKACFAMKF